MISTNFVHYKNKATRKTSEIALSKTSGGANHKMDGTTEDKLGSFLDALRAIPNDEKAAYLTALDRCPHIMQSESCIPRFLRYANGNDVAAAAAAARLFVDYWEKRKHVFGCPRAFQPMTLCHGALSESCREIISVGWIAPLPQDTKGKRVCFLDLTAHAICHLESSDDRKCCLFYALQVISEDVSAQTEGITLVILYDDCSPSPEKDIEGFEDILRVMPVQVTELHIIPSGRRQKQSCFFKEFVPRALKTLLSTTETDHATVLDTRQHIYLNNSPQQVLAEMIECGMRRENLPAKIGGGWTFEHHKVWMKIRLAEEDAMIKNARCSLEKIVFPDSSKTTGVTLTSGHRKKRREAKHSRQKRDRKRCRVKTLNLHIDHLQTSRKNAYETTKKLEKLLAQATKMARELGESPTLASPLSHPLSPQENANMQFQTPIYVRKVPPFLYPTLSSPSQAPLPPPSVALSTSGPISVVVVPAPDVPLQASGFVSLGSLAPALANPATISLYPSQVGWSPSPSLSAASVYRNLAIDRLLRTGDLPSQNLRSPGMGGTIPLSTQLALQNLPFSNLGHPSLFYPGPK